jgi:hypothetical protein
MLEFQEMQWLRSVLSCSSCPFFFTISLVVLLVSVIVIVIVIVAVAVRVVVRDGANAVACRVSHCRYGDGA